MEESVKTPQKRTRVAGEKVAGIDNPERTADIDEGLARKIEMRAYEIYQQRGGGHGYDMEDWLQAEREQLGSANPEPGREQPSSRRKQNAA